MGLQNTLLLLVLLIALCALGASLVRAHWMRRAQQEQFETSAPQTQREKRLAAIKRRHEENGGMDGRGQPITPAQIKEAAARRRRKQQPKKGVSTMPVGEENEEDAPGRMSEREKRLEAIRRRRDVDDVDKERMQRALRRRRNENAVAEKEVEGFLPSIDETAKFGYSV